MGRAPQVFVSYGQRFGRLVVEDMTKTAGGRRAVLCKCDCGNEKVASVTALTSGATVSCGCYRKEKAAARAIERNKSEAPPRLGTGINPPKEKKPQYKIDDYGRECAGPYCNPKYKPWREFNKGNSARGHNSWCRECQKAHYENRAVKSELENAQQRILARYSLTMDKYGELEEKYNHNCWLCRNPEVLTEDDGEPRDLIVDHDLACCPPDRSCGKCIRGLVCNACQAIVGKISSKDVERYIIYLRKGSVDLDNV